MVINLSLDGEKEDLLPSCVGSRKKRKQKGGRSIVLHGRIRSTQAVSFSAREANKKNRTRMSYERGKEER